MGKLYVVGTPIGNLSDFSPRAVSVLESVDFIAAEDTRVTLKLLTHFGIKKQIISYHQHNEIQKCSEIAMRISNGETGAVVSDAGMPCISDPGEILVKKCYELGVEMEVIPCCNAAIAALCISGLPASRFCFEGFLPFNKKERKAFLDEIKNQKHTLIFYEAPHKLKNTLADLLEFLGDRNISACRELTKIHEEVIRGKISELIEIFENREPRGEFVLVVEGNNKKDEEVDFNSAVEMVLELVESGVKKSLACKTIADITSFSKSELYNYIIESGK